MDRERDGAGQFVAGETCVRGHPLSGDNLMFSTETLGRKRRRCRRCNRDVNFRSNCRVKTEVFMHYGGKCACCGEAEEKFLAIDHINGRSTAPTDGYGVALYRQLRMQGYPDGYRVLCHNCNMAIGQWGNCPHG